MTEQRYRATVTVETADTTFCVYDGDELLTEVARTTTRPVAPVQVRKPEPPQRDHGVEPPGVAWQAHVP